MAADATASPRRAARKKAGSPDSQGCRAAPGFEDIESGLAETDSTPADASRSHTWTPRPYQGNAIEKFDGGKRRQMLIWHRRAGKDNFALNLASREADHEIGTYWHLYPSHVQAKRAIWNGIDKDGMRFLDQAFPQDTRRATRIADMQIELNTGSMWQLCGSDRYNSLVGSNPRGVVFSEWALCDPRAWDYIRPIIRENGGWVVFITTYRGRNHAFRMAERLKKNSEWFVDIRTVDDTTHSDGRKIITEADIQAERDEGMSEALIQQEYYCNPVAASPGAIYGKSIEQLLSAERTGNFGYDASAPVYAAWSLEFDEQYTVAFFQTDGSANRLIGSKSYPFEPLTNCLQHVAHDFPWRYIARHIVPHTTPPEVQEQFERFNAVIDTAPPLANVFSVTRDQLNLTWIDNAPRSFEGDENNNELVIDSLNGYRFTSAKGGQSYTNTPVNSWEKHHARALEVFSCWRHYEPLEVGSWFPAPSTKESDRASI